MGAIITAKDLNQVYEVGGGFFRKAGSLKAV